MSLLFKSLITLTVSAVLVQKIYADDRIEIRSQVTPIIVNMLGFSSCRSDEEGRSQSPLDTKMKKMIDSLTTKLNDQRYSEAKTFSSCFGYAKGRFRGAVSFRYSIGQERQVSQHNLGDHSWLRTEITEEHTSEVLEIAEDQIRKLIDGVENPVVYFVSHSWGSWFSLHLAKRLADSATIGGIVSMDPINPSECHPKMFVSNFGWSDPDCKKRPTDMDSDTQLELLELAGFWQHYYQKRMAYIQSGPMEELVEGLSSIEVTFGKRILPRNYHALMLYDPQIWSYVNQMIPQSLDEFAKQL